jgi:hypothetical protein
MKGRSEGQRSMREGDHGGKTDRICSVGDRRRGQAESPERAGVAVRHGRAFTQWGLGPSL